MDSEAFARWWNALSLAPSEQCLNTRLTLCDRDGMRVELAFDAPATFANARGTVQGGFVTAMLDTCLGIPVLLATDGRKGPVSLQIAVSFLDAVQVGPVRGWGRVGKLGKSIAFVEAALIDTDGQPFATATQSAKLLPGPLADADKETD